MRGSHGRRSWGVWGYELIPFDKEKGIRCDTSTPLIIKTLSSHNLLYFHPGPNLKDHQPLWLHTHQMLYGLSGLKSTTCFPQAGPVFQTSGFVIFEIFGEVFWYKKYFSIIFLFNFLFLETRNGWDCFIIYSPQLYTDLQHFNVQDSTI